MASFRLYLAVALTCLQIPNSMAMAMAACTANQVRLSLTHAPQEMAASWATGANSTPPAYAGVIKYGRTPSLLTMVTAVADSRNYTMCNESSPFLHYAIMSGLEDATLYYYTISEPRCGATAVFNFTSAPKIGAAAAYPFNVIAYGDMGVTNSQDTASFLTERTAAGMVQLVIHAGDISYADNRKCPTYDSIQDEYYNEVQPYLSLVPAMFSSGNHEGWPDGQFLAYRTRVAPTMPTQSSGAWGWYSFNYARIHFVAMDSDQGHAVGSPQHTFITSDLASVNRTQTPLVVLFNHYPTFCSNNFWCNDGSGHAQAFRAIYEPVRVCGVGAVGCGAAGKIVGM